MLKLILEISNLYLKAIHQLFSKSVQVNAQVLASYDFITKTYPNGDGDKDGQCFTSKDKNSIELPDGWYTLNASGPFRLAYEHPDGREIYSLLLVRIPFGEHPEYLKLTFDNQGRVYRLSADGKTPTEIMASTVQEWIEKS